jgi:hypothetical protein
MGRVAPIILCAPQTEQFIIFNSLKPPYKEQSMNNVAYFCHAPKFKGDQSKTVHSTGIYFNLVHNSSSRL